MKELMEFSPKLDMLLSLHCSANSAISALNSLLADSSGKQDQERPATIFLTAADEVLSDESVEDRNKQTKLASALTEASSVLEEVNFLKLKSLLEQVTVETGKLKSAFEKMNTDLGIKAESLNSEDPFIPALVEGAWNLENKNDPPTTIMAHLVSLDETDSGIIVANVKTNKSDQLVKVLVRNNKPVGLMSVDEDLLRNLTDDDASSITSNRRRHVELDDNDDTPAVPYTPDSKNHPLDDSDEDEDEDDSEESDDSMDDEDEDNTSTDIESILNELTMDEED